MKTCKKCDLQYDDGKKFCKKCGAPLEGEIKIESKAEAKKQVFEEKLKTDPLNVKLLHEYAKFLFDNKLFKEAVPVALKIIAIDEDDLSANELLFYAYLEMGNYESAAETGDQLLLNKPENSNLLISTATAHFNTENQQKCILLCDKALHLQPANTDVKHLKGLSLLEENRLEEALEIFNALKEAGADDDTTNLYAGIHHAIHDNLTPAAELLNTILSKKEAELREFDFERAYLYYSYVLSQTGKSLNEIDNWFLNIIFDDVKKHGHELDELYLAKTVAAIFNIALGGRAAPKFKEEFSSLKKRYFTVPATCFTPRSNEIVFDIWIRFAARQIEVKLFEDAKLSLRKAAELIPEGSDLLVKHEKISNRLAATLRRRKRNTVITWSVIITIIAVAVGAYFGYHWYQDNKAWSAAKTVNTFDSYIYYLNQNPDGRFVNIARQRLVFEDSRDSQVYKMIQIGDQVWMAENLNVDKLRNGDPIPHAQTAEEWQQAGENGQPAWCYYDNDPANGKIYGKLYNWHAINDQRGLAPEGWQISSDEDWEKLIKLLGGKEVAGGKLKATDTTYWQSPNTGATNETGFTALPGGHRNSDGSFSDVGYYGDWWSTSENDASYAWLRYLNCSSAQVIRNYLNKSYGFSVRCLKDN
jgi:uncharacterized protein (TIGR02145 family)